MVDKIDSQKDKELQKVVKNCFKYFDKDVKVDVVFGPTINVGLELKEAGHLIGPMGQTLESGQYIVRLMANKIFGRVVPLSLDIGQYKAKKIQELQELALQVADNVQKSQYPQTLRSMNAYERRIIHTALTDFDGVVTTSVGEEPYRCVEIKPEGK